MADASCQTVEEQLSFVTFSLAATDLDPDQLVLGPSDSQRSLMVALLTVSRHLSNDSGDMLTILVIYSNNHLMRISFNISLAFVFF